MITFRPAIDADGDRVWDIIKPVIEAGDTYAFAPESSREDMLDFWLGKGRHTYVAMIGDQIAGTFLIKPNQPGLGSHVANAAYMTAPAFRGRGVGKAMGEYSLEEARRLGYLAMQFNIVVKSNTVAVELWQKIGFKIIGEIPDAFRHSKLGFTNAYILYRKL